MNKKKKTTNSMKCTDIQAHLFAYITHDAGQERTELIKKHLGHCSNCQAEAKQIKDAINFLNSTHKIENIPTQLSEKRKKLIARAFMHPIIDFIYRHHITMSIIAAIITITITLCVLRQVKVWHSEQLDTGIPVSIAQ